MVTRKVWLVLPAIGLLAAWLLLLRPTFLGGPAGYIVVSGNSMEPTMYTGDLAVVHRQEGYEVGDIVAFQAAGGIVIHRIVGGSATDGFIMQGDNKDAPDPWKPKLDEILGKLWLRIPGAGHTIGYLRQPAPFAALVATIAAFALVGPIETKRRSRRGKRMPKTNDSYGLGLPASPGLLAGLGGLLLVGLACGAGAFFLFLQPLVQSEFAERLRYEHTAAFEYSVQMERSVLYPDSPVGPVVPGPDGRPAVAPPAIYTRLARTLDLDFAYALKSSLPPQVSGELGTTLEIRAGKDGWSKTDELLPLRPFAGPATTAHVSLDLPRIGALIETIEKETGFSAGSYDVSIVPTVRLQGQIGAEAIDEVYAPAFTLKVSKTTVVPDAQLARSDVKKVGDVITRELGYQVFGLWVPVANARWLLTAVGGLALLGAALLAAVAFLGLGRDENARIRARYGSLLISVAEADLKPSPERVHLASLSDLAKLAQRDGQTIFHLPGAEGGDLYFIHRGEVVYIYTSGNAEGEG